MSPRPILKRSLSTEQHTQQYIHHHHRHIPHPHTTTTTTHAVHFPPSPSLTRTFSVYSASAYDRSPIVVSPNSCALPERGCPGRTYLLEEQASSACAAASPRGRGTRALAYARDYHPRALAFASAASYAQVPPLVPDLSSESEESDGFYSMPASSSSSPQQTYGIHGLAGPNVNGIAASVKYHNSSSNSNSNSHNIINNNYHHNKHINEDTIAIATGDGYTPCDDPDPLAFLPYGPSSPPAPSSHFALDDSPAEKPHKARRKRSDARHESSADPDRIPRGGVVEGASVYAPHGISVGMGALSLSQSASASSPMKRKKGVRRAGAAVQSFGGVTTTASGGGGFCSSDDGCLGGF